MTPQVMQFAAIHGSHGKTLEIGSRDWNGILRNFYQDYVGIDSMPGPNVDIVASGNYIPFKSQSFDRVIYLDVMEHDLRFWDTFGEVVRVLKPGGVFVVTSRGIGFRKHGAPNDYYRFTGEALCGILALHDFENIRSGENTEEMSVFGSATKR